MTRFRDAGFIQILDERGDAALQERFTTYSQSSSWSDTAAGWDILTTQDFNGPHVAIAVLTLLSAVVFVVELFLNHYKQKPIVTINKIHPIGVPQNTNSSLQATNSTRQLSSGRVRLTQTRHCHLHLALDRDAKRLFPYNHMAENTQHD